MTSLRREIDASILDFFIPEMIVIVSNLQSSENGFTAAVETLEQIGYNVGNKIMEKYLRDSEKPRFDEETFKTRELDVEIIRFLASDFFSLIWKENKDKESKIYLRKHKERRYTIEFTVFPWFRRFSSESVNEKKEISEKYLYFPSGIIRGALSTLGIKSRVTSSTPNAEKMNCKFELQFES